MKILVADKFPQPQLDSLAELGCQVVFEAGLQAEALKEALARERPDVLIVRGTEVRREHLEASPPLALVVRAGAGVNSIDVDGASRLGIYVANCPGKNAIAVAELAFAHILALDRHLVDGTVDLRRGRWNKATYQQAEGLHGRVLGLLGLGNIGREMIRRATAFGLQVVAWSRSLTPELAAELGVEFAPDPVAVARQCDVLSVHLALTDDTRGLVGEDVLAALPDGATVINTSRGEIVDQESLERHVRERGLKAGLDVFWNEPKGGEAEMEPGIFALPGVHGSHHIGASTQQAQHAVADEAVRVVTTFLAEGSVPNCVNLAERGTATHLLVVRHRDRVGVLASVLGALREAGINVQEMENALFEGGHAACAKVQIDREPDAELLDRIYASSEHLLALTVTAL